MISQESLPKASLSSQEPQAIEEDVILPGGTDGLSHYRRGKNYSSEDGESSRDICT